VLTVIQLKHCLLYFYAHLFNSVCNNKTRLKKHPKPTILTPKCKKIMGRLDGRQWTSWQAIRCADIWYITRCAKASQRCEDN